MKRGVIRCELVALSCGRGRGRSRHSFASARRSHGLFEPAVGTATTSEAELRQRSSERRAFRCPADESAPAAMTITPRPSPSFRSPRLPSRRVSRRRGRARAGGCGLGNGRLHGGGAAGVFHLRATSQANALRHVDAAITIKKRQRRCESWAREPRSRRPAMRANTHLVRTPGGEWWLFFNQSGTQTLQTMHSRGLRDLGAGRVHGVPSGHSGDGRDLSVALRVVNSHAVVHITQGFPQRRMVATTFGRSLPTGT